MKFSDLSIGQTFDWVDPNAIGYNSFFMPCMKTSPRKYVDTSNTHHRVGSIHATVFHVDHHDTDFAEWRKFLS